MTDLAMGYGKQGQGHLMLPVLDQSGQRTGYLNRNAKAKSLVQAIVRHFQGREKVHVEVFPAGRDPVNGQWIHASFSHAQFSDALIAVAAACLWNLNENPSSAYTVDLIPPASPSRP